MVVGREDAFTSVADHERMQARIPHATLAVIDAAGHLPNLEQPGAFNDTLARFLATPEVADGAAGG